MKPQFSHFTLFETFRTTFESMLSWFLYTGEASSSFLAVCRLTVRENIWCAKFCSRPIASERLYLFWSSHSLRRNSCCRSATQHSTIVWSNDFFFFFQMNALPGWMPPDFSYLIRQKNWIHTCDFCQSQLKNSHPEKRRASSLNCETNSRISITGH